MHAGSFVLFYTINDSDKVEDLKKKMIWNKCTWWNKYQFFCFDIYCSRKQKLYKPYKGPNSINELFVVEHYTAKVPFHFRDKC